MATGSPRDPHCSLRTGYGSGSSGPGKSGFSGNFFSAFFASMDLLGPQGHHPDGPESPNPDPDREMLFFENPDFSFFRLFKLLQYGCLLGFPLIWVVLRPTHGSLPIDPLIDLPKGFSSEMPLEVAARGLKVYSIYRLKTHRYA